MTSQALGSGRNPSTHLASCSSSVPFITIDLSGFTVLWCWGQREMSVQTDCLRLRFERSQTHLVLLTTGSVYCGSPRSLAALGQSSASPGLD